ncbi:hypothetical protein Cgig2_025417 [Carnegiea gigantea]|uniref:Reverse transcriptase zinc-binding domain-containing protein n=1 Tax=Carnegiea gigantea TaxID=171969 RepID=A0A9Q1K110_9CARY|nr:hypothetical protein Cgig2_025417 [Carnegiea gigantea]
MKFEEAGVCYLLKNQSDNYSPLISPNGFAPLPHNPKPFLFQAAWTSHELFDDFLKSHWTSNSPIYPLLTHLSTSLIKGSPRYSRKLVMEEGFHQRHGYRAKYCSGRCDIDMFTPRTDTSNAWKEILKCAKFLKEEAKTDIDEILKKIASIEVYGDEEHEDLLIWNNASNGFTIKLAPMITKSNLSEPHESIWKLIWTLKSPQRIKFFIWLAVHKRIMTNAHRARRQLSDNPLCNSCHNVEEDVLHILCDCQHARRVWLELVPKVKHNIFFTLLLRKWIHGNLEGSNRGKDWATIFAITLWWI